MTNFRGKAPGASDFREALARKFEEATAQGQTSITVESRDLHRQVGGYPGSNHRMPICCDVMYENMQTDDEIIYAPPKGRGATLTIRYRLPRQERQMGYKPKVSLQPSQPETPQRETPAPSLVAPSFSAVGRRLAIMHAEEARANSGRFGDLSWQKVLLLTIFATVVAGVILRYVVPHFARALGF